MRRSEHENLRWMIPEVAVIEMVCDWAGAGRAITGRWDLSEWYKMNREKIRLRPENRAQVDALIAILERAK